MDSAGRFDVDCGLERRDEDGNETKWNESGELLH